MNTTPAASFREECSFYARYALFQFRERFTEYAQSAAFLLMYPILIWLLTHMWGRFNAHNSTFTQNEIFTYLAITELLFLNFMRSPFLQRSHADFSLILARPRSWPWLTFVGQYGTTWGGRILYAGIAMCLLPMLDVPFALMGPAMLRLLLLLPLLGITEALMGSIFASAQLLWHETRYFMLPTTKIFLALGGVFCPLSDYGEPGRSWLLPWPPSDLFFQVGHFCVKGEFYGITATTWLARILGWTLLFAVWNVWFYRFARKRHQSFGG